MKAKEKIWFWAALGYFSNYFQGYEVGEEFTITHDLVHTPRKGDMIRICEFDLARLKKAKDKGLKADDFSTGRDMLVECLNKVPNTVTMQWGMPRVTAHGPATFRIIEKNTAERFDPKLLYP